jgi:FMN phosphatase YigB (HAD superfamily)
MPGRTLTTKQVHNHAMEFIREKDDGAIVCFDYFDTLVTRIVAPQYTKQIACFQLSRILNHTISGKELYQIRCSLEASLCEQNAKRGLDLEFNLKLLGEQLFNHLDRDGNHFLNRFSKDQFASTILNIEVAVEKLVQRPCQDVVSLLNDLKKRRTTTILISDFYLPGAYFSELLRHHELDELFDQIYISSDFCITKGGQGRLYDKIIQDHHLNKNNMLMIGDNPHADGQMAKEKGIESLVLCSQKSKNFYRTWENRKAKQNCQQKLKKRVKSIRKHGGAHFPEMGISLWWFIWKLLEKLIRDDVASVFFLSREGELLKILFDALQEGMFGNQIIKTHYLLASRKSTYIASLKQLKKESFSKLFFQYRDISPKDFLLSLNFSQHQAVEICDHIGIAFDEKHVNFPDTKYFKQIISNSFFEKSYENLRVTQRENFIRYLLSFDPNILQKEISFVEVGWKGSIQDNIFNILKQQVRVTGYYIGLLSSPYEHPRMKKIGILFSEGPPSSPFMAVYNNNRSLFEMVLGASHGSAEGYFSSRKEIEKRWDKSIYMHQEIKDDQGAIFITTVEHPEEKKLFVDKIKPIQLNILRLTARLNQIAIIDGGKLPDEKFFAKQHGRMTFFPRKGEIDFFEALYHLENFGVFEFTKFHPDEKVPWKKRLFNLKSVLVDPDLLEIGFWPPIILRHLGIDSYRHVDGLRRAIRNFGLNGLSCILPF